MSAENNKLIDLRHTLHSLAELSDNEINTSQFVAKELRKHNPTTMVTRLGGYGILAMYAGQKEGPTTLLRCELDALPIAETITLHYASLDLDVAHKCGHDGHMTILLGLARQLAMSALKRGRVALLFQPSEETGAGARRVLQDERLKKINIDYVFALHNLPGFPVGSIVVKEGPFASASKGLIVDLTGRASHAGEPEKGNSPELALVQLMQSFSAIPQTHTALHESAKVTLIHASLGEKAFGTSLGKATLMATLRAYDDSVLKRIKGRCLHLCKTIAEAHHLSVATKWVEEFPATVNHHEAVRMIDSAAKNLQLQVIKPDTPFSWSEDFGNFTASKSSALFGIGSGVDHAVLHSPEYDFPDEILMTGIQMYQTLIKQIHG